MSEKFEVIFYKTKDDKEPMNNFIKNLSSKMLAKLTMEIEKAIKYKNDWEERYGV